MTRVGAGRVLGALGAAVLLAAASGCVSGSDIDQLHRHISAVEKEVETLQKQSTSKDEIAKLNDSLTKQSNTLLRSNADLGTKFDDLTREMQSLAGKLEDTNRRLAQLSQQIAEVQSRASGSGGLSTPLVAPGPGASSSPAPVAGGGLVAVPAAGAVAAGAGASPRGSGGISPADLFAQATADYQRGRYDLARQGFEDYAEKFPRTDLSDDALYWAGECWSAQKKPREAITAWDKLFRTYPQSDKAAAAHLKKGLAHLDLGEKAQAMVELNYVVNQFPSSDEAKSARQRLKALGGDAR